MPELIKRTDLEGGYWHLALGGSKGNILDAALMGSLSQLFDEAARTASLKAIVLEGEGKHFSFGASVQEHLPEHVAGMLERFRALLLTMARSRVVTVAAVRGQCLGGALELVSLCHRVVATRDAKLGQPEILLGVFAPVASVVLPRRIGQAHADDLCLTGRTVSATEALEMGLVDEVVAAHPVEAALHWARTNLGPISASSLRFAVEAVRAPMTAALETELPKLEKLYLERLMKTSDAVEGLKAFLEKRPPKWRNA